jgi:hypothetical protein
VIVIRPCRRICIAAPRWMPRQPDRADVAQDGGGQGGWRRTRAPVSRLPATTTMLGSRSASQRLKDDGHDSIECRHQAVGTRLETVGVHGDGQGGEGLLVDGRVAEGHEREGAHDPRRSSRAPLARRSASTATHLPAACGGHHPGLPGPRRAHHLAAPSRNRTDPVRGGGRAKPRCPRTGKKAPHKGAPANDRTLLQRQVKPTLGQALTATCS